MLAPILAAALLATPQPGEGVYLDRLARTLAGCGLARADFNLAWDETQQDETVAITAPSGRISDRQIKCIADLSFMAPVNYQFTSPDAQHRFYRARNSSAYARAESDARLGQARDNLAKRGLLEGVLRIAAEKVSAAEKAGKIEAACGFPPGSAVRVMGGKAYVRAPNAQADVARLGQLVDALTVVFPGRVALTVGGAGVNAR